MLKQIEGSQAVAQAVAACRPEVICAYPISPQTHIVEALSAMWKKGELGNCEYVNVESEFSAMSASIGASATGARSYTATASQGLLFMVEAVYNASGLGLPIVMTVANRAIGSPINIWNDQTDSMSQRDSGWLQLYATDNQEAADLHVQAFKIAEELSLPRDVTFVVNTDEEIGSHCSRDLVERERRLRQLDPHVRRADRNRRADLPVADHHDVDRHLAARESREREATVCVRQRATIGPFHVDLRAREWPQRATRDHCAENTAALLRLDRCDQREQRRHRPTESSGK